MHDSGAVHLNDFLEGLLDGRPRSTWRRAPRRASEAVPPPFPVEWCEVRCHRCGVIEDCVGVPHTCLTPPRDRRVNEQPLASEPPDLVGEIVDYLASDQGRYDALVAALIIRAR